MRRGALVLGLLVALLAGPAFAQTSSDFDGDGRANTSDSCRFVANPGQQDSSALPDGVGDACTCGDVDGTGVVNLRDAVVLRRALAQLAPGVADAAKCSVTGGSMDCDVADATRLRQALAAQAALEPVCRAHVGAGELPTQISVAGDSITRAFAAGCTCNFGFDCLAECVLGGLEQPEFSWFDGGGAGIFTLLDRYLFFDASVDAHGGAARSGARMRGGDDSFQVQAGRILAQTPVPDFVVVLLGGNDLCSRDCAAPGACATPLWTDAQWREAIGLGLGPLAANLPAHATVYLGSVPRVQDLYGVGLVKQVEEDDVDCELAWEAFDVCRIATDPATRNGETQALRLAALAERQRRFNEILREEAALWDGNANGQNPRGIRVAAEYTDEATPSVGTLVFGRADINGSDCFHPSIAGQGKIAERMWLNSPVR
jgi:lysophospholipase L1-like esterase